MNHNYSSFLLFISDNSFPVENACNTVGCVMISAFDLNDTNDCDIKVNIITFHITTEKIKYSYFLN